MRISAAATCILLAVMATASAGTYNGVQTISDPTDQGATHLILGGTGTDTEITVAAGGSFFNETEISVGYSATGKLVIDGGTVGDSGSPYARDGLNVGRLGTGTVEIKGGTLYAGDVYFARGGGSGVMLISGGAVDTTGTITLGNGAGTSNTLTLSGGTLTQASTAYLYIGYAANSSGAITLSGGTADLNGRVYVGDADSYGRVDVIGSATTVNYTTSSRWFLVANSTLAYTIDSTATGVSCLQGQNVSITGGLIDLDTTRSISVGETFALLRDNDGSIAIGSLSLSAEDQEYWTLTATGGNTLSATCIKAIVVPEPATLGLLGFGVIGLVMKRRQNKR